MTRTSARAGKNDLSKLSLWNLSSEFDRENHRWPKKLAAEVAFALALAIKLEADKMGVGFADKKAGYVAKARSYALQCVALAGELPAKTMSDVATSHTSLAGIIMPNYFYLSYIKSAEHYPDFASLLK